MQLAIAGDGTAVYASGSNASRSRLVWVSRSGGIDTVGAAEEGDYGTFAVNAQGTAIAAMVWAPSGPRELWVIDLVRGGRERVATTGVPSGGVHWIAQAELAFAEMTTTIGGPLRLTIKHAFEQGSGDSLPYSANNIESTNSRSSTFVLRGWNGTDSSALVARDSIRRPIILGPSLSFATLSPNGKWFAFTSSRSGRSDVYVASLARPSGHIIVSTEGGEEARWTSDGTELIFRNGERWYTATITGGETPASSRPRMIFEGPYLNVPGYSYDLSPDGQRVLALLRSRDRGTQTLNVITDFHALVARSATATRQ
jgi:dipeptidyl aminopeptidase/acylaminoacyl peptidase